MIPALQATSPAPSRVADYLAELRLRGFEGDIGGSHAERTVFATDNSVYQLAPQAILFRATRTTCCASRGWRPTSASAV